MEKQLSLDLHERPRRGGYRENAGRRRTSSRVPHRARPVHKERFPVHVTLRAVRQLPSFRQQLVLKLMKDVLTAQQRRAKGDFRIPHFSIQRDHLHLIVEARDGALARGVRGFVIAFARRLNRLLGREGRVWSDRYHRKDLTCPRQTRNTLSYVLKNDLKHRLRDPSDDVAQGIARIDVFSSAALFDGWSMPTGQVKYRVPWPDEMKPRTWLLDRGWKVHGLIDPRVVPSSD
jgi:putative transposase